MVILSHTFTDSFTHFHTLSRNFHTIWAILSNFGLISTCWVSKSMYLSWGIQWQYFHTLSQTPSHTFMQFGLFWAILAQVFTSHLLTFSVWLLFPPFSSFSSFYKMWNCLLRKYLPGNMLIGLISAQPHVSLGEYEDTFFRLRWSLKPYPTDATP